MADLKLLVLAGFGERLRESRAKEQRIVPESVMASRLMEHLAFNGAASGMDHAAGLRQRDDANEAGPAIRSGFEALERKSVVLRVGGMFPGETSGPDARSAAQRIDLKSGI